MTGPFRLRREFLKHVDSSTSKCSRAGHVRVLAERLGEQRGQADHEQRLVEDVRRAIAEWDRTRAGRPSFLDAIVDELREGVRAYDEAQKRRQREGT